MTPEVEQAIAEIRQAFPEHTVEVQPESQGGAYIIVHNLLIGEQYTPSTSWIGFLLGFQYPQGALQIHIICSTRMKT